MRHQFAKRVFYLDEDSWALMIADLYDAQGKLWRVQESSIYPAYEIPACVGQEFMSYDLTVGRYIAENATQERPETDWLADAKVASIRRSSVPTSCAASASARARPS